MKRTEFGPCPICAGHGKINSGGTTSSIFQDCYYCNGNKSVVVAVEDSDVTGIVVINSEEMVRKSDVVKVARFMSGSEGDFPGKPYGKGNFYWREILRDEFSKIGISY